MSYVILSATIYSADNLIEYELSTNRCTLPFGDPFTFHSLQIFSVLMFNHRSIATIISIANHIILLYINNIMMTVSISNLTTTTIVLIALTTKTTAFTPPTNSHHSPSTTSSTQLQIIGPLIRKMRGDEQAKNMPMSSLDEARLEAPGLRVGKDAWKWPPVWPYDSNFFKRDSELAAEKEKNKDMNPMNALMGGGAAEALKGGMESSGSADGAEANGVKSVEEESSDGGITFDSLKYWNDNENVKTELDERVVEKITK